MTKLEQTIQRMKDEVLADVLAGRVPDNVKSFGDLHDFVEANYYGGFIDDDYEAERDAEGNMTQAQVDFFNACQDAINEWITSGHLCLCVGGDETLESMGADDLLAKAYELRQECWEWANRYQRLKSESITRR